MFDWDKDQDDILERTAIEMPAETAEESGYLRATLSRWLAPAAVICGIALAGHSVFRVDLPFLGAEYASASVGGLRATLFRAPENEMPSDLIVYGADQYENFMQGIVRFSDTDLLQYAATTERDLQQIQTTMTPYMLDALLLTQREIERRGLSRPMASAEFDSQRAFFREQQQAL